MIHDNEEFVLPKKELAIEHRARQQHCDSTFQRAGAPERSRETAHSYGEVEHR